MQELSDFWRSTAPDAVNISEDFSPREFAVAFHHLKPGKLPGPDSTCPELLIHAGPGLKFWLHCFLSSCMHQLKITKVWRRALVVMIPKPSKPVEDPHSYHPISLLCIPYKILKQLIYNRVEPIANPLLPKEQAGFQHGKSTVDQVVLLTKTLGIFLRQIRRLVPCLSIWQLFMTWSGTMASTASCWDFCQTSTWSRWSWNLFTTEALPWLLVTASQPGSDVWKMISHRDQSWFFFFSTYTYTICFP